MKFLKNIGWVILLLALGITAWSFIAPKKPVIKPKSVALQILQDKNPSLTLPNSVVQEVPFTPQSPFAEWSDPEQNSGCEEASMIMATHWLNNEPISPPQALIELKNLFDFENSNYGNSIDTSAADTKIIFERYYSKKAELLYDVTLDDIISKLAGGNIILAPMNGKALKNPHFRQPGPETHMLVIKGYDDQKRQFITNDPGTKAGESYAYSYETLYGAMRDYPTGNHLPITEVRRAMLVIKK